MYFLRYCLTFLIGCCTCTSVFAQAAMADTAFVRASVSNAVQTYRQTIGNMTHLYNGQEYVEYRKLNREGHQFFQTDEFSEGKVVYDGSLYENIPMAYDIVRDELIIRNRANSLTQRLIPEKVSSFQVHGHYFVRYTSDSLAATDLAIGFYNVLFDDSILLLAKRRKLMEDKPENYIVVQLFKEVEQYYIRKDRQYYQVKRKRNLYNVFKDRKKELQRYAREQKLNFRDQREAAFIALVSHYNSLVQ